MSTVLIALLFLLNALLMPLVVELVKERGAGLALRGIRLAVRLLPGAHRDRYREEWTAELDAMERQHVSQLVSSLRILLGAPSMGWVLRVRDRRRLLVEGRRERLTEGGKARKIFVTLLTGALAYLLANLSEQPQLWVITVAVFIGGITQVVQFVSDFENRLGSIEEKQETHLTEMRLLIKEGLARTNESTKRFQAAEVSALQADAITQLVRHSTQVRPDSSPLVAGFARLQINRMSQVLKELSEGVGVSYDGEDRDWLLGLTMQSRHTIDAISLSTVHAAGEGFDGGLWNSDLGQRYLELQRDATRREVVIRRVFVIDQLGQTNQDNLLRLCRQQKDLGFHVKVLDQSAIPDAIKSLISDFVVFDSVISYEVPPVSHDMKSTTVKTHLVLQSDRVKERMRQFEVFWSAALEIY